MSRLKLQLEITGTYEIDGGYYSGSNMVEIEELLKRQIRTMKVFVGEGQGDPKAIPSTIKLLRVIYEPQDS
jgi:hypothetical protein